MEELWDNNGPFALVTLAGRQVPVPRDNAPPVTLYALCRAWVRNNPFLPLTADSPSPLQALSGAAGPSATGGGAQGGPQQHEQQGQQESQNGLISMLPPLLAPTPLETGTSAPSYPFDDFEIQEQEEALRKLKDHWSAVRQYHQAVRRAKLSRHRERLQVLLGEPSMLHAQAQANAQQAAAAHAQQAGAAGMAPNGLAGLQHLGIAGFQGALMLPDQAGAAGGPVQGLGGQMLTNADAQAALATIMSLGQALPDASLQPQAGSGPQELPTASQQHQQQLLLQLQQAGMVPANGAAAAIGQQGLGADVLAALQQQQHLPQDAAQAATHMLPPVFAQRSAMAGGAAPEHGARAEGAVPVGGTGVGEAHVPAVVAKDEPVFGMGDGQGGASGMDIDPVSRIST